MNDLNNRWFDGRAIYAELSPVTDFHEACCQQYQMGSVINRHTQSTSHVVLCLSRGCPRGGFCNFMHLKLVSEEERYVRRERERHFDSRFRKRLYQRRQKKPDNGNSRSRSCEKDRRR